MDFGSIFQQLQEKIALISSYHTAARSLGQSELQKLTAALERASSQPDENPRPMSFMNFTYRDPRTGGHIWYSRQSKDIKQVIFDQTLQLNKQYQWLLAEAYEVYEDFLDAMFACAGFADKTFWPLADYGNISLSELDEKEWAWYLERAQAKKNRPESILVHFRKKLPKFALLEKKNALEIDLSLSVALITQLRHHIVHTAGRVKDRDQFVKKVLSSVGLYPNNKPALADVEYVQEYFFDEPHADIIGLLDQPHPSPHSSLHLYVDVFGLLVDKLLASAHLLTAALIEHCNPDPA